MGVPWRYFLNFLQIKKKVIQETSSYVLPIKADVPAPNSTNATRENFYDAAQADKLLHSLRYKTGSMFLFLLPIVMLQTEGRLFS